VGLGLEREVAGSGMGWGLEWEVVGLGLGLGWAMVGVGWGRGWDLEVVTGWGRVPGPETQRPGDQPR